MITIEAYLQEASGQVEAVMKNSRGVFGKAFFQNLREWQEFKAAVSGPLSTNEAIVLRTFISEQLSPNSWESSICRSCGEVYSGDGVAEHIENCEIGILEECYRKLLRFKNCVSVLEA